MVLVVRVMNEKLVMNLFTTNLSANGGVGLLVRSCEDDDSELK